MNGALRKDWLTLSRGLERGRERAGERSDVRLHRTLLGPPRERLCHEVDTCRYKAGGTFVN